MTMLVEANSVLRQSKVVREDVTFVFNNERERGDLYVLVTLYLSRCLMALTLGCVCVCVCHSEFELRRLYIRVKKARLVGVTVQPQ